MTTEPTNYPPASPELRDYYAAVIAYAINFPDFACDPIIKHHSQCVPRTGYKRPVDATAAELRRATVRLKQQTADILAERTVQAA